MFVKWKSEAKAALILNMKAFNHACAYKARRFQLPTLEGLAGLLRVVVGGWATKIDPGNCYWSIHLPPHLTKAIRVGVGSRSFAIVRVPFRVPFSWHQVPGLVQHLITTAIAHVDPGTVVVVLYLDDILCVGKNKQQVHAVTASVAAAWREAGFLIGAKSILHPAPEVTWMGKTVNA